MMLLPIHSWEILPSILTTIYGLQSLISPQIPGILTPPNSHTVLQTYQQDFVFWNVVAMIFSVTSCSYEILSIKL